ncbi:ABC transporter substrate-binding protein [Tuanshanicoccus lijuaniae]|uniref:ABC transporter substrate-binding protein n=1 Tax=Aerococcaceae bacterium zg-1292 TaxID=2774330 RepID=UPI0019389150|nr:ABC transporter substrate-binding protein [Aerococcaceae bacterium zg-1292]QQA37732.1 ABC transporter substrate-binding protein [Aerococcaceae bacterium zg-1292]
MKRLVNSVVLLLAVVGVLFFVRYQLESSAGLDSDKTIVFYNWGDYIDPEIIKQFEKETGYRVIYETYDSNEAMVTKVEQGGTAYDLLVPSEYMVESMIKSNLLQPLNYDLLPNFKHIDSRFKNQVFDPENRYSIPYFWGTLGIVYNKEVIKEKIEHWDDLWNEKYRNKILLIDGAREVMGIGLQSLGFSLNETDDTALTVATAKMKALMSNVMALAADEIKMYVAQGEAPIAVTFSGEAATAMEDNKNLAYVVPSEGSNIWFDNIVIPKNARNVEGAHALINYLMRPDIAAKNAEYIGYATPNKDAIPLLDPEITEDKAFYPSEETMKHLEVYQDLGQNKLIQFNDRYLEVKMEPR